MNIFLNKRNRNFLNQGFSVLEVLSYVAVFMMVFTFFINIFFSFNRSNLQLKAKGRLDGSASIAMERMLREIRSSSGVDIAQSSFGSNPGSLYLNQTVSGNPSLLSFSLSGSNVEIQRDGDDQGTLLHPGVYGDSLVFSLLDSGRSKMIKIKMTLRTNNGQSVLVQNYYGSALLRGSY